MQMSGSLTLKLVVWPDMMGKGAEAQEEEEPEKEKCAGIPYLEVAPL